MDHLIPRPGRHDYLIANGSRALVSEPGGASWPLRLMIYRGREFVGARFSTSREGDAFHIVVEGELAEVEPVDLSLLVRTCIRNTDDAACRLQWPAAFNLLDDDRLAPRLRRNGDTVVLSAGHADLRPTEQSAISDIYRHPLDVPWLYDRLDYDAMLPLLNRPGIRRVLDLGCGTGRNAVALENAGFEVYGIDAAAECLAICRNFVQAPGRFQQAKITLLPYANGAFDAVLDVGCLHMIADPDERKAALAEAARVLRLGGVLCGRALKPRTDEWLAAQPFKSCATGFTAKELAGQSSHWFSTRILGETEHLVYYELHYVKRNNA
jgi:SAM-dependent methyltransferase